MIHLGVDVQTRPGSECGYFRVSFLYVVGIRLHQGGPRSMYGHVDGLYHERQSLLNCGVHALNNLYQQKWVDAATMDALADRVAKEQQLSTWFLFNPYRSFIPRVGNYDVSVIVEALKTRRGCLALHLLNNRRMEEDLCTLRQRLLDGQGVVGLIVNRETTNPLRRLVDGRHWLAIILRGLYYDLDSKAEAPLPLGDVDSLIGYLRRLMVEQSGQVFLVVVEEGDKAITDAVQTETK